MFAFMRAFQPSYAACQSASVLASAGSCTTLIVPRASLSLYFTITL